MLLRGSGQGASPAQSSLVSLAGEGGCAGSDAMRRQSAGWRGRQGWTACSGVGGSPASCQGCTPPNPVPPQPSSPFSLPPLQPQCLKGHRLPPPPGKSHLVLSAPPARPAESPCLQMAPFTSVHVCAGLMHRPQQSLERGGGINTDDTPPIHAKRPLPPTEGEGVQTYGIRELRPPAAAAAASASAQTPRSAGGPLCRRDRLRGRRHRVAVLPPSFFPGK